MTSKNVQDGISRLLGSREIQKTKVSTVLLDTLYLYNEFAHKVSLIQGRCQKYPEGYIPSMIFLGGVQTIFKVFRVGQGLFIDSREGLEKIEKMVPKQIKIGPSFFRGGQPNFQSKPEFHNTQQISNTLKMKITQHLHNTFTSFKMKAKRTSLNGVCLTGVLFLIPSLKNADYASLKNFTLFSNQIQHP